MTIFERIRNKANQAITGVKNFIDQDDSMGGIQLAKGGLMNRIASTPFTDARGVNTTVGQRAGETYDYFKQNPNQFNLFSQGREQGLGTGISWLDEPVKAAYNTVPFKFMESRVIDPLLKVPANTEIALDPTKSKLERGIGGLSAGAAFIPGVDDAVVATLQALQERATGGNKDVLTTDYTPTPLGDILRNRGADGVGATALDFAELPLMLGSVLATGKGADQLAKRADDLAPVAARQADDFVAALARRPKNTMYVTPEGTALKVNKQPTTMQGLDKILEQAKSAIAPADKEVIETTVKSLPSGEIPFALPAPAQNNLTITQLKKLAAQGDNLENVKFTAKTADEAREAVRVGLKLDQIEIPPKTLRQADDVLQFPQEEAALRMPPKTGVQGVRKSGLASTFDDLTRSSKGVIERSGASGKRIKETLDIADEEGALTAGAQVDQMHSVLSKLSKQEKATLADVIEGTAKPISEAQAQAAAAWKEVSTDIFTRAREQGLDIGFVEGYFPHHVLKGDEKAVNSMLNRTAPRRYGNLELSRQTDMPYDKDPSVLMDYIESANKRIAEAKHFGANDEVLYNLANEVAKEGGDNVQVMKYLDQILGKEQAQAGKSASEAIRSAQTVLKLNPGTAVTNLTQNISTMLRTDVGSVGKAVKKAITNPTEAWSNARRAGEISADEARVLADYAGEGKGVTKWLRAIGMLGAERVNRVIAVNAGMEYTTKLARQAKNGDQAALRELSRLGMTLDDFDALKGGRRISQQTQFTTAPGELPYSWHTPLGKVMTQFKSFAYKQTGMLANEAKRIASETSQGNFKPLTNALITYGVAAPIAGEIVNDVKSLLTNKKRDSEFLSAERYVENILGATSLGLLDSTGGLFGEYGTAGVISTIGGVTAGDIYKGAESIAGLSSDDEYDKRKAARFATNQIPFGVGKFLSNTLIPNAYVDNLFGGVNEGLGDKDKQTYQNLQKSDPEQAEIFKQSKIESRKEEDGGFLSNIFGGDKTAKVTSAIPGKDATPEQKKEFNKQVQAMLDAGGVPDDETLRHYVTKGKDPVSKSIEERTDAYKGLKSAMDNEYYTEEQKDAILKASGVDPKNYDYYELASKDQDVRLQELLPKLDNMEGGEMVEFLMRGRKAIAGKQLVSNAMVDYLYENDYIGENEKDAIKALKYDEIQDKFYFSKSFAKKGQGKSLTYKQAKALFNMEVPKFSALKSMDNLLARYGTRSSQTASQDDSLIENILQNRPTRRASKTQGLWF
jgi:hypothetical protein